MGAPLSAMARSLPSLLISAVWFASPTTTPDFKTFSTGFSQGALVCSLMILNASPRGLPTASACMYPVSSSATLFMSMMLPLVSVVMTPSPIERSVTRSVAIIDPLAYPVPPEYCTGGKKSWFVSREPERERRVLPVPQLVKVLN